MVVDGDVVELIKLMDGKRNINDIVKILERKDPEIKGKLIGSILELQKELKRVGVAYKKNPRKSLVSHKPLLENITINVTHRCNLRCKHCYIEDAPLIEENLNIHQIRNFIREGKKYLSDNLNYAILGGEPLLRKDLVLEIAKLGYEQGKEVIVSTNGIYVDETFAYGARDTDLVVQVSLEGSKPQINDQIRGNGSYQKAVKGIEKLVDNGAYTIISMVVQRSNLHDIVPFYQLGKSLDVDEIRYIPLKIMGRAISKDVKPVTYLELLTAIKNMIDEYPDSKIYLGRDYFTILKTICSLSNKRLYCGTGLKTLLIDPDGEVYPCPNHALPEFKCGNINNSSFNEIWLRSDVLKKIRSSYVVDNINNICPECEVKYWCMGGCRGEAYANSGKMDSRPIRCNEIKEAIIEMFWLLGEEGEIIEDSNRIEYF